MRVVSNLKQAFVDTGKALESYAAYKTPRVTQQLVKIQNNNIGERLYFFTNPNVKNGTVKGIDIPDAGRIERVRLPDGSTTENLTTAQLAKFQLTIGRNEEAVAVLPCNVLNKGNNNGKIAAFNIAPGEQTPETWYIEQTSAENLSGKYIIVNIYYE